MNLYDLSISKPQRKHINQYNAFKIDLVYHEKLKKDVKLIDKMCESHKRFMYLYNIIHMLIT